MHGPFESLIGMGNELLGELRLLREALEDHARVLQAAQAGTLPAQPTHTHPLAGLIAGIEGLPDYQPARVRPVLVAGKLLHPGALEESCPECGLNDDTGAHERWCSGAAA